MSPVLESTDAFQSPRLSLESDLTEKSHKTSFKEQRWPASPSPHHLFTALPPCLSPCPASFIHQMQAGKRVCMHLQASPLRGCKSASIWIDCKWPGGSSPLTATAPCLHPSDSSSAAPALGHKPTFMPSVQRMVFSRSG